MRITNSTLRRIIAEEYAEILAETKKRDHSERVPGGQQHRAAMGWDEPEEEIDWEDEEVDYYGDPDPFGDDAAEAMGLVPDDAGGWKKPAEVDDYYGDPDPFGDDAAAAQGLEPDDAGGWKKPEVDDYYGDPDPFGDDAAEAQGLEPDGYAGWKKPGGLSESRWTKLAGLLKD